MTNKFIYKTSVCCFYMLVSLHWMSPVSAMNDEPEKKTTSTAQKTQKPSETSAEKGWENIYDGCGTAGVGMKITGEGCNLRGYGQGFQDDTFCHNFMRRSTSTMGEVTMVGGIVTTAYGLGQAALGLGQVGLSKYQERVESREEQRKTAPPTKTPTSTKVTTTVNTSTPVKTTTTVKTTPQVKTTTSVKTTAPVKTTTTPVSRSNTKNRRK